MLQLQKGELWVVSKENMRLSRAAQAIIGLETARQFALEGATVAITGRKAEGLEAAAPAGCLKVFSKSKVIEEMLQRRSSSHRRSENSGRASMLFT